MKSSRQRLGQWGEDLAGQYLTGQGYSIIERNLRTPFGEIDIIARQTDGTLVFVEVKTRRSQVFGPPEVSVTATKKAHLLACIQSYLSNHPDFTGEYRLDVIAIQVVSDDEPPEIVQFENAIS